MSDSPLAASRSLSRSPADRSTGLVADVLDLTKARLVVMVLITAAAGYWVGAASGGELAAGPFALLLGGIALLSAGGAAFNHVLERRGDSRMRRTEARPVVTGRISPNAAWTFGLVSSSVGILVLLLVEPFAAVLGAFTVFSYAFIYTPLKRVTQLSTLVGAVPGALPPLIGWAASIGEIGAPGWILFGILFFWQLPHFLAIAWLYRRDYRRGGYPVLTVVDPTGGAAARQMLLGGLALIVCSLMPAVAEICAPPYFAVALALGTGFFAAILWFVVRRSQRSARAVVLGSVVYLPALLCLLVSTTR